MSNRLALLLPSLLASGLLATACGAKSNEGAPGPTSKPVATANSGVRETRATESQSDASDSGGAFDCGQYVGQGTDILSLPAAYMFVGAHPMCAEQEKVKEFCSWLATREGFLKTQEVNRNGAEAPEVAKSLPEESRDTYLAHFPKQVFERALQKCGLNLEQQRSKLVAEAESAIAAGAKADTGGDVSFLLEEAPARAELLWKRECDGHYVQKTVGEGYETHFAGGKSSYASFCMGSVNADTIPPKFKAPGKS